MPADGGAATSEWLLGSSSRAARDRESRPLGQRLPCQLPGMDAGSHQLRGRAREFYGTIPGPAPTLRWACWTGWNQGPDRRPDMDVERVRALAATRIARELGIEPRARPTIAARTDIGKVRAGE